MDRRIVYSGQLAHESDMLLTNKFSMLGVSYLAQAILGNSPVQVYGLGCTPDPDPGQPYRVVIAPGQVYAMAPIDATSFGGAVDADITHEIKKQGILADALTFSCPKPTSGKSIYYLIEVAFQEIDEEPATLLYYNSANPSIPFTGPGNNGAQQNTVRRGKCDVRLVTGIAANTGTEVVPSADPGFVGIWTVRVSSGTTNIVAAASATTDGIWKVNDGIRVNVGGGGGSIDDSGYAKLAFANQFNNTQNINVDNVTPLIVRGGATSAGTGIKIIGEGATTPSKTIRVRGGVLGIQNHVQNASDILTLDDGGNLILTGYAKATSPTGAGVLGDTQVATVGWCNGRFALTGAGGFLTDSAAEAKYVRKDAGASDPQSITTQLNVGTQAGYSYVGLPDNHVATARWVRAAFAASSTTSLTPDAANLLYVPLAGDKTVGGIKMFDGRLRTSTTPALDGSGTNDVVNLGFANGRYAQLNATVSFAKITLADASPGTDDAIRRSFADGRFLKKDSETGTQTLTNGTIDATGVTFRVKTEVTGTEAVNFTKVTNMINAATGGSGNFAVKNGANTFASPHTQTFAGPMQITGGATFSGTCPSSSVTATAPNDLVRLQDLMTNYASKTAGTTQAFTSKITAPNGTSGTEVVNYSQVFGAGGFAVKAATNDFTARQDFTAAGAGIRVGTGNIAKIELGGTAFSLELTATGIQMRNSGADLFTVNGVGAMVAGSSLKVGNTGVGTVTAGPGNFAGAVAAGTPNGSTSVPRLQDFANSLGTSGYIDIPIWSGGTFKKLRIQWKRALTSSFPYVRMSWPTSFSGSPYAVQATPDYTPSGTINGATATNADSSGVDIYAPANTGTWVLGIGLAP